MPGCPMCGQGGMGMTRAMPLSKVLMCSAFMGVPALIGFIVGLRVGRSRQHRQ